MKRLSRDELIESISGAPFTFNRWCISGIVPKYAARCECSRCRDGRNEPHDEALAESTSRAATEAFQRDAHEFLERTA